MNTPCDFKDDVRRNKTKSAGRRSSRPPLLQKPGPCVLSATVLGPRRRSKQSVRFQSSQELIARIENWILPAPIGGLQQQVARALPVGIGLVGLGKVEHEVARIGQRRQCAPVVEVKARRQFAGPSHQLRILNSSRLRSHDRRFASDCRRQNTESIQP